MAHEIRSELRDGYLFVHICGELDLRTEEQTDREILRLCQAHACKDVLIDVRDLAGELNETEAFQAGSTLADRGLGALGRIAIVDRIEYQSINRFYETVAVNRGFALKFFTELDEAEAWLRG